ncbi:hypothetical protein EGT81_19335 [Alcaligenes faecalis]|nr:hypothetical protein EGT81_19335 [Alcaligenes faecalis]
MLFGYQLQDIGIDVLEDRLSPVKFRALGGPTRQAAYFMPRRKFTLEHKTINVKEIMLKIHVLKAGLKE